MSALPPGQTVAAGFFVRIEAELEQPMDLTARLAAQIVEYIRDGQVPPGARLVERTLADQLRVSRSPVRSALRALHSGGIVGTAEGGGYVALGQVPAMQPLQVPATGEQEAYRSIAEDRLAGRLPDRITEAALAARYHLTRGQLAIVLRRIDGEGWIERLPGRGWAFQPLPTSKQAYADGYRFRVVIEPAAILDPRFEVNRPILERCRDHQQRLIDGEIRTIANITLLERNSELHQAVIACSRNPFYVDGLKRVDILRRLMEIGQSIDRDYALTRCQDHLRLAELLLADRREEASELMRRHLSSVDFDRMLEGVVKLTTEQGQRMPSRGTSSDGGRFNDSARARADGCSAGSGTRLTSRAKDG